MSEMGLAICSIALLIVIGIGAIMLLKEIELKEMREQEKAELENSCDEYNEKLKMASD